MFQKNYQIKGPLPGLEELEADYKKSGKYPTEIIKGKTGIGAAILGKDQNDYLYITKNKYHGVGIMVYEEQGMYFIQVGQCIPSRIVAWLRNQVGFLLLPLFPMIWGKQKEFYKEVDSFIKDTYPIEKTLDINDLNIMTMFHKKTESK